MHSRLQRHPEIKCEVSANTYKIVCDVTTYESPLLDFFILFPYSCHSLREFLVRQFVLKCEKRSYIGAMEEREKGFYLRQTSRLDTFGIDIWALLWYIRLRHVFDFGTICCRCCGSSGSSRVSIGSGVGSWLCGRLGSGGRFQGG